MSSSCDMTASIRMEAERPVAGEGIWPSSCPTDGISYSNNEISCVSAGQRPGQIKPKTGSRPTLLSHYKNVEMILRSCQCSASLTYCSNLGEPRSCFGLASPYTPLSSPTAPRCHFLGGTSPTLDPQIPYAPSINPVFTNRGLNRRYVKSSTALDSPYTRAHTTSLNSRCKSVRKENSS